MKNVHPNLQNLSLAAKSLAPLNIEVVFVGGATAILYVDDQASSLPRPTVDVDCVVEVASTLEYHKLEEKMRAIGFQNDTSDGAPICRWKKGPLIVDLMPVDSKILGFSNSWYEEGFRGSQKIRLFDGSQISIFSFSYFVASKFEALMSRGVKDLILSQDLEDILFVMEGRKNFLQDLREGPEDVLNFVRKSSVEISKMPDFEQAVMGNMPRGLVFERQQVILRMFTQLSS